MKTKSYKFNTKGLNKAILDVKQYKINRVIDVGFYVVIGFLILNGTIGTNGIISMAACSGTSKVVKWFMR
jgi:hypothetical protein